MHADITALSRWTRRCRKENWRILVEICIGLEINGYRPAEF
jgi:hypothetical protein